MHYHIQLKPTMFFADFLWMVPCNHLNVSTFKFHPVRLPVLQHWFRFFFRVGSTLFRLSIVEVVINYCHVSVGSTPIAEVGHKHCGRPNDNIIHMITRSISLTCWFYEIYNVNDGKWKKLFLKKRPTETLQIAIIQMHTRLWFVPASHALSTMSIWITSETFTSSRRILSSKPSDRRRFL